MFLRTLGVVFSLALASCASNVSLSSAVELTPTGAKLSFLDITKFDRDLSGSLQDKNASVEVAFYDKVSPNNVPDRLQKWISVVEADGGKVLVEPPQNEFVARSPFAALSLVDTLITSVRLQTIKAQGKKFITLSGDSHNGWFTNLTTLAGDKVGVEFAGSSVTSPGFESAGLGGLASSLDGTAVVTGGHGLGLGLVDDLNYVDTIRRGYLLMTATAASIKGEFIYVDTIQSTTYTATTGKTVTVNAADMTVKYS